MRTSIPAVAALWMLLAGAAAAAPLRVLVTNDDGFAAQGISDMVAALVANPNLQVSVFAPATNQSGTGENITTGPVNVTAGTTLGGYPATSVAGFPADALLFGVLKGLPQRPDFVVSGINFGQNPGDISRISGTVGAALWAARLGIPAIAVSQSLGAGITYTAAASYVAGIAERYRTNATFRHRLLPGRRDPHALILNVNFPTCTTGSLRGVRVVPLGRVTTITDYMLTGSMGGVDTYQPVVVSAGLGSNNCVSSLASPANDIEALSNGFASVTPMQNDATVYGSLSRFRVLEQ
jgi:5'/3'-nucleotidase